MSALAIAQDIPMDAPTSNSTIEVVIADSSTIFGNCLNDTSRYINTAKTNVYITAMADASVAVNIPPIIPPIIRMTSSNEGSALTVVSHIWAQLGFGETG